MSSRKMAKQAAFETINPEVAVAIFRLHREHPNLGHDGLLRLLREDSGYHVDPDELTKFLDQYNIHGERWKQIWGHRGIGYASIDSIIGG